MDSSPRHFFDHLLPHLVLRSFEAFVEQQGTLAFDITGAGQWSLTFGSEEPVAPGLDSAATLTLTFTSKAFERFIDGTLDIADAVRTRQVTARGTDFSLLEAFARLLRPPATDLGWDVSPTLR